MQCCNGKNVEYLSSIEIYVNFCLQSNLTNRNFHCSMIILGMGNQEGCHWRQILMQTLNVYMIML